MNVSTAPLPPRAPYLARLDMLLPGRDEKERELRSSLMLMRDRAGAAMNHCCDEAYPLLAQVAHLAGFHAFAPMPIEALESLRYQLVRLTSCAAGMETFAQLRSRPGDGQEQGA